MKKNKFLALLLTCAMVLTVLAGCGSKDTPAPAEESKPAESSTYKIALIQQHQTNAFQIAVTEGAQAKAAELGV